MRSVHTQKTAPPDPPKPGGSPAPQPPEPRNDLGARLGLSGPEGVRRRGALLRRLLAIGDWVALFGALCVATTATETTDIGTLFWATIFSPVWILVFKLHGLYDNDHRRIRHSTLDEVPSLVSASALGTIALDGLLALSPVGPLSAEQRDPGRRSATLVGSFAIRAVLRFSWNRITGQPGRARDRLRGRGRHRRPADLHPP